MRTRFETEAQGNSGINLVPKAFSLAPPPSRGKDPGNEVAREWPTAKVIVAV